MMEAMSPFPPIRSSSRTGSPSKASQYDKVMARLYQAENELAAKDQMNTMLQAKLSSLLRKCDSREQKLHTNNIAMRKMESDMTEKLAKLKLATDKVMAGEKYERMQDDLRRRASTIMDNEKKLASCEDKLQVVQRKGKATAFQLRTAREQATAAETEVLEEKKRSDKLNAQLASANIKLRDMQHSLQFTGDQLEERELETAKLRVTVQMLQEELDEAGGGGSQQTNQADSIHISNLQVENRVLRHELRQVNERIAAQVDLIDTMSGPVRAQLAALAADASALAADASV